MRFYESFDSYDDLNNDGIIDVYEEACEAYTCDNLYESSDLDESLSGGTVVSSGFERACESYGINPGTTSEEHWQAFDEVLQKIREGITELSEKHKIRTNGDNGC